MITKYHSRIQEIRYKVDPRLKLVENGSPFDLENLLEGKMKQLAE
jgi:CRISPR-associated protein Csh2